MKKLSELPEALCPPYWKVGPDSTVSRMVSLMAAHKTSALLVFEADAVLPCGIVTEQDLVRCHTLFPGKNLDGIRVADIMTPSPTLVDDSEPVEVALNRMLDATIRHLPVTAAGQVRGLIRLEDLARAYMTDLNEEISHLQEYIRDFQEAAHD